MAWAGGARVHTRRQTTGSFVLLVACTCLGAGGAVFGVFWVLPAGQAALVSAVFACIAGLTGLAIWRVVRSYRDQARGYRSLLDTAHDAIFLMRDDRFIECNPRTLDMYGCRREEIVGQSPVRFSPPVQPDGRPSAEAAAERIRAALAGQPQFFEWQHTQLDGTPFDAEVSLNRVVLGRKEYLQAVVRDVTPRKQVERERERLAADLRQAQKLEAVGTLAGGIAHDFNNLLHAVRGYADLLLLDTPEGAPGHRELTEIAVAATRGSQLTHRLLTFSRRVEAARERVDLNELIRGLRGLMGRTLPRMIDIRLAPADDLPAVEADRGQLEQVLVNLAVNARDAMPDGGQLVLATALRKVGALEAEQHPDLNPGAFVELSVTDSGCGMDEETLDHIFEPFFTTKAPERGTGLGLAMVYGIIKGHGGAVLVQSTPGEGTSVRVMLPAAAPGRKVEAGDDRIEKAPGGNETVLLVDDERPLRELGQKLLTRYGYQVVTAASGEAALEVVAERSADLDLVILDQIMPGMGGRKCLGQIRERWPDLPVMIVSGHGDEDDGPDALQLGAMAVLRKPVESETLLAKVRSVLDDKQGDG